MNNADEASTSRIVDIILRSIHLSDETPVEESMVFVELCSKEKTPTVVEDRHKEAQSLNKTSCALCASLWL